MAFNKTYEDFINEMKAVENTKQLVDDDFFLSIILPLAYERTLDRLKDYADGEEDVMMRKWNMLVPLPNFDQHFTWQLAADTLQRRLGVNSQAMSDMFNHLHLAIVRGDNEVHIERAMARWNGEFPLIYT